MRFTDVTFKFKRATSDEWQSKNTVLGDGEPGVAVDRGNFKIGDGHSTWSELDWFIPVNEEDPNDVAGVVAALNAHINSLTPHTVYDDGPSLALSYENQKV